MAEPVVCTVCETVDYPRRHTRGSFALEVALWCTFIVPGVIYSLWRVSTREHVCRACGRPATVPFDTPVARRIVEAADRRIGPPGPGGYLPGGDGRESE